MVEELLPRAIIFVTMVAAGVVMLWLARATASGRLGRNQLAGVRTAATLRSDEAWLAGHRAAERPTKIGGWCAIASSLSVFLPVPTPAVSVIVLIGAVVMLGFLVYGSLLAGRAARAVSTDS